MAQYEYTVVPFIGRIKSGLRSTQTVTDVAAQLAAVIQTHSAAGWMFHSVNSVNIEVKPGCIASLFGKVAFYMQFDQIVFFKEVTAITGQETTAEAPAPFPQPVSPPAPPPLPQ
jgi:hypothetical protein